MKKVFFILLTMATVHLAAAQSYVREKDSKSGKPCLRGKVTFQEIEDESVNKWLYANANAYEPNDGAIRQLRSIHSPYRFVVFMGTWCSDTHELLPKFYKVLNQADIDLHAVEMYGVNRDKKSLELEHVVYKIERVPTIIVLHQNREVGRITESVSRSIEDDLVQIMAKDFEKLEAARAARR
jgi:thiol-disulfide isomerase/thioredoxin